MKCPKCQKDMIIGKVESDREILWVEDNEMPVRIPSRLFVTSTAKAERCAECGIVVIEEN